MANQFKALVIAMSNIELFHKESMIEIYTDKLVLNLIWKPLTAFWKKTQEER